MADRRAYPSNTCIIVSASRLQEPKQTKSLISRLKDRLKKVIGIGKKPLKDEAAKVTERPIPHARVLPSSDQEHGGRPPRQNRPRDQAQRDGTRPPRREGERGPRRERGPSRGHSEEKRSPIQNYQPQPPPPAPPVPEGPFPAAFEVLGL